MISLCLRSSQFTSSWMRTRCTVLGLVKQISKGGCSAMFTTNIESLDEEVETLEDVKSTGSPSKNHSMQQQTGSSLNNPKTTSNIQNRHGPANNRYTRKKFTGVQMDSKYVSRKLSEIQAPDRTDDSCDTRIKSIQPPAQGGGQISNKPKDISQNHAQMLVTNFKNNKVDAFAALDSRRVYSEREKLISAIDKIFNSAKIQQPSAASGARMTGELLQKTLDSGSPSKNLPSSNQFPNKRHLMKHREKRFGNARRAPLQFVVGDDLQSEKDKKEEVIRKQMSIDQVKESNTITGGEKSVGIEYVPRNINLLDITDALSIYGEIVGCFLRTEDNELPGCHIEFKNTESKERALCDRWVSVNGKQLSICRIDCPVTTVVRITNLGKETSVNDLHSICMSYGKMESLQMKEDGVVDVHFSIDESCNLPKILQKLNEVTLNGSRWIAQPAPRLSHCLSGTPEGQKWVGQQLSNQIRNIKKQLQLKRIILEDLENLHNAIMHIKECPNPVNNGS